MFYSSSSFGKTKACVGAKQHFLNLQGVDSSLGMKEAGSKIANAVKGVRHLWSDAEIEKHLRDDFSTLRYGNAEQAEIRLHDAVKDVTRYVNAEKERIMMGRYKTMPNPLLTIEVSEGIETMFHPHIVFYTKYADGNIGLKSVILKTGKAQSSSVTQKGADNGAYNCLQLYLGLQYLRKISRAFEGRVYLTSSMYFLRQNKDTYDKPGKPGKYEEKFFDVTGAGNVISITEEWYGRVRKLYQIVSKRKIEAIKLKDWDEVYAEALDQFKKGVEEEECSETDCERCPYFDACKYTLPPLAVKTTAKKSGSLIRTTRNQDLAIDFDSGVARINAGPGSGKTFVITRRVARLLDEGVEPSEILLITFTDAAAKEMRDRIQAEVDETGVVDDISDMRICTFNAFGNEVIKDKWAELGFTSEPFLLKNVTRKRIIADILNANPIKELDNRNFDDNSAFAKGPVYVAEKIFDVMKKNQLSVYDTDAILDATRGLRRYANEEAMKKIIALYDIYDETLRSRNYIEFSDQESLVFETLFMEPHYFDKFGIKHVIVDEFQDTSEKQVDILKALYGCKAFESLFVVGDDSQAIYGFRDTSPEYIINFPTYIGAKVDDIFLVENHRSTPEIVDFANEINNKNTKKIAKTLVATRKSKGQPVVVKGFFSLEDEYKYILDGIKKHIENGVKPEDIAFIGYTKAELMKMGSMLREANIPSVMMNPEPLIENGRVRAGIAMIKAIQDPKDTKDLLSYANGVIGGGILQKTDAEINAEIGKQKSRLAAVRALPHNQKRDEIIRLLKELDMNEDEVYQSFIDTLSSEQTVQGMLDYCNDFYRFGFDEAIRRNRSYPGVVLTTAHSSKGLEWNVVYNSLSKYDSEDVHSNLDYEEERRRLLFVSATRAKNELFVTGQYIGWVKTDPDNPKNKQIHYNEFLLDSYDAIGEPKTNKEISLAYGAYNANKKAERDAKKAKKAGA